MPNRKRPTKEKEELFRDQLILEKKMERVAEHSKQLQSLIKNKQAVTQKQAYGQLEMEEYKWDQTYTEDEQEADPRPSYLGDQSNNAHSEMEGRV